MSKKTWVKHFKTSGRQLASPKQLDSGFGGTSAKYSSILPEVYAGHPNRIQRYYQFDDMSKDSDISAALDTIADFCTQSEEQSDNPFLLDFADDASDTEIKLVTETLNKWVRKNNFKGRLWKMFRDTIKNGDSFFIRDPETHELLWLDHFSVEMVKVSSDGKKEPQEYVIKNFDPHLAGKFGNVINDIGAYRSPSTGTHATIQPAPTSNFQIAGSDVNPYTGKISQVAEYYGIKAEDIVHLSLNEGMDVNWPFGQSILEPIFKTFKQKELLEDAIVIYRVQRAPERRIFKIDCGDMTATRARAYIESVKNEINQRRIPNRNGGGNGSAIDTTYSPLSMLDDYYFAVTTDGRGSDVSTLPGGESLGEIGDLTYFTKKMARGLRIPTSYLSLGDEEAPAAYNDGKMGQALVQEFRFNKYCVRLQNLLVSRFNIIFKEYLEKSGISVEESLFDLKFHPPQNFTKYRQIELDQLQAQVYSSVAGIKQLSERWKLRRYLNMTDIEIAENERMWAEENAEKILSAIGSTPADSPDDSGLGAIGVRGGGGDDFGDFGDAGFDDSGDFADADLGGDDFDIPADGGGDA